MECIRELSVLHSCFILVSGTWNKNLFNVITFFFFFLGLHTPFSIYDEKKSLSCKQKVTEQALVTSNKERNKLDLTFSDFFCLLWNPKMWRCGSSAGGCLPKPQEEKTNTQTTCSSKKTYTYAELYLRGLSKYIY